MDPLSLTANVITVLQVVNSIVAVCFEYRAALIKAPWSLTRVSDDIRDLRNVLEGLERVAEKLDTSSHADQDRLKAFRLLCEPHSGPLARCHQELIYLQRKIGSAHRNGKPLSKQKLFIQVMGWQLRETDANACLKRIERLKNTIILAMTADEATLLISIQEMTDSLNNTLINVDDNVSKLLIQIRSKDLDEQSRAITHWLSPTDPWSSHEVASGLFKPGTGQWFLESHEFREWCTGSHPCMWLSGFPGSGKTILFSNIIATMTGRYAPTADRICLAFFYCDFRKRETQDAVNVLGSLIAQLCSQLDYCPPELEHAFKHCKNGNAPAGRPSLPLMKDVLHSLSRQGRLILLIDAIDECGTQQDLLNFITDIENGKSNVSILVTSREESVIREELHAFHHVRMEDWTAAIDEDIGSYVDGRLLSDPRLSRLRPSVKQDIKQAMCQRSAGMFRLAQCALDGISTLWTVHDIKETLNQLPQGLTQMYENILTSIPKPAEHLVRRILLWLSFAVLPLTLQELHSAIAIEQGLDELDEDSCLGSPDDIPLMCGSLLSMDREGHVRLAHLSVKDYLLSDAIRSSRAAGYALEPLQGSQQLALDCFTYLSFRAFGSGPCQSEDEFATRLEAYPFLRHASTAWTYYLRGAHVSVQKSDEILHFFAPEYRSTFMSWIQVLNADDLSKWDAYPRHATALYYAASFGLLNVVNVLIGRGADLDAPGSRFGGTALHGAVLRYHTPIVEALLEARADPNQADFNGVSPLHTASAHGHLDSIRLLLQCGSSRCARDCASDTAMDWAIRAGQAGSQELLKGATLAGDGSPTSSTKEVWKRCAMYCPEWYERQKSQMVNCD